MNKPCNECGHHYDIAAESLMLAMKRIDNRPMDSLLSLDEYSRDYIQALQRRIKRPSGSGGSGANKTKAIEKISRILPLSTRESNNAYSRPFKAGENDESRRSNGG